MKANSFLSIIALLLSSLLGYLVFCIANEDANSLFLGIGSFLCLVVSLVPAIGMQHNDARINVNIRILSFLFAFLMLSSSICFAFLHGEIDIFVICNGTLLAIYLIALYRICNTKEI